MKRLLILAACASLGACGTAGVRLTTAQALYVAEAGVDGVNLASASAANSGLVHGDTAVKLKGAVDTANTATTAAHAAYVAGDMTGADKALTTALQNVAAAKQGASGQ